MGVTLSLLKLATFWAQVFPVMYPWLKEAEASKEGVSSNHNRYILCRLFSSASYLLHHNITNMFSLTDTFDKAFEDAGVDQDTLGSETWSQSPSSLPVTSSDPKQSYSGDCSMPSEQTGIATAHRNPKHSTSPLQTDSNSVARLEEICGQESSIPAKLKHSPLQKRRPVWLKSGSDALESPLFRYKSQAEVQNQEPLERMTDSGEGQGANSPLLEPASNKQVTVSTKDEVITAFDTCLPSMSNQRRLAWARKEYVGGQTNQAYQKRLSNAIQGNYLLKQSDHINYHDLVVCCKARAAVYLIQHSAPKKRLRKGRAQADIPTQLSSGKTQNGTESESLRGEPAQDIVSTQQEIITAFRHSLSTMYHSALHAWTKEESIEDCTQEWCQDKIHRAIRKRYRMTHCGSVDYRSLVISCKAIAMEYLTKYPDSMERHKRCKEAQDKECGKESSK